MLDVRVKHDKIQQHSFAGHHQGFRLQQDRQLGCGSKSAQTWCGKGGGGRNEIGEFLAMLSSA